MPSQPAIPTFDDSDPNRYWSAANPTNSVKVAGTGTKIEVVLELGLPIGTSLIKVSTPKS